MLRNCMCCDILFGDHHELQASIKDKETSQKNCCRCCSQSLPLHTAREVLDVSKGRFKTDSRNPLIFTTKFRLTLGTLLPNPGQSEVLCFKLKKLGKAMRLLLQLQDEHVLATLSVVVLALKEGRTLVCQLEGSLVQAKLALPSGSMVSVHGIPQPSWRRSRGIVKQTSSF